MLIGNKKGALQEIFGQWHLQLLQSEFIVKN